MPSPPSPVSRRWAPSPARWRAGSGEREQAAGPSTPTSTWPWPGFAGPSAAVAAEPPACRGIGSWFDKVALSHSSKDVRFLLFAAEGKVVKNRVHVCLQPADRDRDREVERVLALGATMLADHRTPDGDGWAVRCDPAGNEFCTTRSSSERHS
ncbi:VOC family protein [Micromonospora sp. NPDC000668]|uniref:VOC family protein n=1 Tax=Micromonospora sp. NPDC000668 TaxID=3364219 RepID=UPI0036C3279B